MYSSVSSSCTDFHVATWKWKIYWLLPLRGMIIFSSHHMPTSQSYPNIKCIIQMIDTDSYINIACIIAKRTILSHLNVNSLYNEYKNNYMGPLFTIWIEEIYRICTNKKPFSCAYWSPLTQDLLLSSACVCLCLVVIK